MGLKLHELLKKRGNEPSQALPRQIPPFVTYGDIFPRSGGSLSSQGEPSRKAHG